MLIVKLHAFARSHTQPSLGHIHELKMTTKDYERFFDPNVYLNTYYNDPKQMQYGYRQLFKFSSQLNQKDLKFLEYGGGPVVSRLISALPHVKDIVFSEYLKSNREAVQTWIDEEPEAFDWRSTFEFIVQEIEGKGEDEVAKRAAELRQKIRAIVPCDIRAENILEIPSSLFEKYGPPYDVVSTSLCLESVVESEQEYKDAVANLAKLVKAGGYLVMHGVLDDTFYTVGSKKFYNFKMNSEMVLQSMKDAGLYGIQITLASSDSTNKSELEGFLPLADVGDMFLVYGRA